MKKDGSKPSGKIAEAINRCFGSFDEFKKKFSQEANDLFGSGWVWLVQKGDGSLGIRALKDAENPMVDGDTPLLTIDVWEHAYYIDYRNDRAKYIEQWWHVVDFDFINAKLK